MTTSMKQLALVLAGAAVLFAAPASAQQVDARWTPWIGCWQAVAGDEESPSDDLLCVRPTPGGVEVIEVVEGQARASQTLVADGQPHDVTAAGCQGWRSVEFSLDGQRLFTRSEQACGDDPLRPSTGVIAMVSPREWIDVQATDVEGQALSWVRRYRPARPALADAAGFETLVDRGAPGLQARAAATTPDVDDMIEASQTVDAEAVRAWVAEMNDPFDLDSRRLIRLADAGVPASVIDVMVAVSYPESFAVQRDGDIDQLDEQGRSAYQGGYGRPVYLGSSIWNRPFYYSPFGYGYGYGGYGYGGYGYGYGPYDSFYPYGRYYQPGTVIVAPRTDPNPNARVVRGRGYSRGEGATDSGGSARSNPPAGRSNQPNAGGSSGGGSSAPSSGGSSGGSSEGRTARPR
jgi:hypothetical protein